MQLTTFAPHLATACPGVPSCEHEASHAGPHTVVCSPEAAYCAPGRCYCPPPPQAAPRGPRWGKYGQADGELVADLLAELRDHLAALRAAAEEARR